MVPETPVTTRPSALPAPRRYRRKPLEVFAHQVTVADLVAIAAWCGGVIAGQTIQVPCYDGITRTARPGDYITESAVEVKGGRRRLGVVRGMSFATRFVPAGGAG